MDGLVEKNKQLFHDKVVVITGASSGLGFRIAREFIKENANLSICARRLYKLKKIYKGKAKVFLCNGSSWCSWIFRTSGFFS